jgi:type IV secretion system protein VirB9
MRYHFTILVALVLLTGCATQPAPTPSLVPAALINAPPKPVHIPPDPLDTLSPAVRRAYLMGATTHIRDGFTIIFPYSDHAEPTIYCSPLHVTEIILGQGERITNSAIGDSDRWEINASRSHILVKPTPPGHGQGGAYGATAIMPPVVYSTNLIAETDKRTYHFVLQSTAHRYTEQVIFFYPDEITAARDARALAMREAAQQTAQAPAPDALNFNYRVSGANVPWRPVQVFSDRSHTYIQFSDAAVLTGDMPALFTGEGKGQALVNYDTRGNACIADRVLTQAALAEGTGANRQVVRIEETR